jgi:hypothetical protein
MVRQKITSLLGSEEIGLEYMSQVFRNVIGSVF